MKDRILKLAAALTAAFSVFMASPAIAATLDCALDGNSASCDFDGTGGTPNYGVYNATAGQNVSTSSFSPIGNKLDEDICLGYPGQTLTYELYDGVAGGGGWSPVGDAEATDSVECAGSQTCGNGAIEGNESCDDGDTENGDGCSDVCEQEAGWNCSGAPSQCWDADCGNGTIDTPEACDDGGNSDGDGCSYACDEESGWSCSGEPSSCSEDAPASTIDYTPAASGFGSAAGDVGNFFIYLIMGVLGAVMVAGGVLIALKAIMRRFGIGNAIVDGGEKGNRAARASAMGYSVSKAGMDDWAAVRMRRENRKAEKRMRKARARSITPF